MFVREGFASFTVFFAGFLAVFLAMNKRMGYPGQVRALCPFLRHTLHLRFTVVGFFFFLDAICFTLSRERLRYAAVQSSSSGSRSGSFLRRRFVPPLKRSSNS